MPEVDKQENEVSRTIIVEELWQQPRKGIIYEVEMDDGRLKYNVQVTDVGREAPFIDQYLSKEEGARGLLKKVIQQAGGNEVRSTTSEPKRSKKSTHKLEDSKNHG